MALDIGASGEVGLAFETTAGTYVAPTKFIPVRSESLKRVQDTVFRRTIKGVADVVGANSAWNHIEGDIEFEVDGANLLMFLAAGRLVNVRSGAGPYVYTLTPGHGAGGNKDLSITVVRAGVVFGYTGCKVGSLEFSLDGGIMVCRASMMGLDEAVQSDPAQTYSTDVVYNPGDYAIEIPTSTPVTDTDTFTLSIEDNLTPEYRLVFGITRPAVLRYGERNVTLSVERDFLSRADYDAFKALTAQNVQIKASKSASDYVQFNLYNAIKNTYEVGLSGQGDLVRAAVEYQGVYDATNTAALKIAVGNALALVF
jgi:hypothetical protein